jgi:putative FmdB family regulatory protein
MPIYEYRCVACSAISSVFRSASEHEKTLKCEACGGEAARIISRPSVHLSKASKLDRLDPKYDKLVDKAMQSTPLAEPDRLLKKLKPTPRD